MRNIVRAFRELGLALVIVALGAGLAWFGGNVTVKRPVIDAKGHRTFIEQQQNTFLNFDTLLTLMKEASFIAIMATGATLVIITGGIDLSVGSVYALSAVSGAWMLNHFGRYDLTAGHPHAGWPFFLVGIGVLCACFGAGLACGFLNGAMVTLLRIHPFIITLGTMAIFRGIAFVATKGQAITPFPPEMQGIMRWDVGPALRLGSGLFPVPLGLMLIVTIAAAVFLSFSVTGRQIYALGGNYQAARLTGLNVNKLLLLVFTVAGGLAGLASLMMLGYYGSASSDTGAGYELDVIAAAVVGGASLTGGRGTALGTMLGAILIKLIDQGIVILKIDQNYSRIIIGCVIILAVGLDQFSQRLSKRRVRA